LDYLWHPSIDLCWDITKGLPFPDSSIGGIFTEHCLEHFPLPVAVKILEEFRRVLCPGGAVRVVVPDAQLYLDIYVRQIAGDTKESFPYQEKETFRGISSPILSVNRIFYHDRGSLFGHWFIYDAKFLSQLLRHCGFDWAEQATFRQGVSKELLIDAESRKCESLYVEAGVAATVDK
jgi:ubiquinone/menaquinone biosynthesis C-methylase UbiE